MSVVGQADPKIQVIGTRPYDIQVDLQAPQHLLPVSDRLNHQKPLPQVIFREHKIECSVDLPLNKDSPT